MSYQEFDLFGDPCRLPNGRRGRPAHVATLENRNKVMMLLALGWSNERIAGALHCSLPTLRKHYFSELKTRDIQRDRLDAYRFERLMALVKEGNVGALRLLDQMIAKNDLRVMAAHMPDKSKARSKEGSMGKKEKAMQAARDVAAGGDGDWMDDLKPGYQN